VVLDGPPEEGPAREAGHGPVVDVLGRRLEADLAFFSRGNEGVRFPGIFGALPGLLLRRVELAALRDGLVRGRRKELVEHHLRCADGVGDPAAAAAAGVGSCHRKVTDI